jgi:hypothetical protein
VRKLGGLVRSRAGCMIKITGATQF